jgi:hypothetical protein
MTASSSSRLLRDEHSPHALRRCKMASPVGNRRKTWPLNLANADILLDQPVPDHSTRALLSNKMGDATVNGDMPSSSFLSVSTASLASTSLRRSCSVKSILTYVLSTSPHTLSSPTRSLLSSPTHTAPSQSISPTPATASSSSLHSHTCRHLRPMPSHTLPRPMPLGTPSSLRWTRRCLC